MDVTATGRNPDPLPDTRNIITIKRVVHSVRTGKNPAIANQWARTEERVRMEREVEAEMARQVQEMREELARYSFYYSIYLLY